MHQIWSEGLGTYWHLIVKRHICSRNERLRLLIELSSHILDAWKEHLTFGVIWIDQVLHRLWVHAQLLHHVGKHVRVDATRLHPRPTHHHGIELLLVAAEVVFVSIICFIAVCAFVTILIAISIVVVVLIPKRHGFGLLSLIFFNLLLPILLHHLHYLVHWKFASVDWLRLLFFWHGHRHCGLLRPLVGCHLSLLSICWYEVFGHRHDKGGAWDGSALDHWGDILWLVGRWLQICSVFLFVCIWFWWSNFVNVCIPLFNFLDFFLFDLIPIVAWRSLLRCDFLILSSISFLLFLLESKLSSQCVRSVFSSFFSWLLASFNIIAFWDTLEVAKLSLGLLRQHLRFIWSLCGCSWLLDNQLLLEELSLLLGIFTHAQVYFAPLWIVDIVSSWDRHVDWSFLVKLREGHCLWFALRSFFLSHCLYSITQINY